MSKTEPDKTAKAAEADETAEEVDYIALYESAVALLEHLSPGIVVDDELGNVAYKRDGTPVYVGELEAPAAVVEDGTTGQKVEPKPARRRPPRPKNPRAQSPAAGRAGKTAEPDIDSMSVEERAALYENHIEKGYK